jgi:hypothetical protein
VLALKIMIYSSYMYVDSIPFVAEELPLQIEASELQPLFNPA